MVLGITRFKWKAAVFVFQDTKAEEHRAKWAAPSLGSSLSEPQKQHVLLKGVGVQSWVLEKAFPVISTES